MFASTPDCAPVPAADAPEPQGGTQWATDGTKYWGAPPTQAALPPGVYKCDHNSTHGYELISTRIDTDALVELPNSPALVVLEEIRRFWGLKEAFTRHGLLHKRGVLLWGPPGSGKTVVLAQLTNIIVREHGGLGVRVEYPPSTAHCLQLIRRLEPDRPIILLLEDVDAMVKHHGEDDLLALLDGESQVDNVVCVATTNYPELLDRRFTNRPSRFDLVMEVGMPTDAVRRAYLVSRVPDLADPELAEWVRLSGGYSFAHMRELVVLVRCYDMPLATAAARLNHLRMHRPASAQADDGERTTAGFR